MEHQVDPSGNAHPDASDTPAVRKFQANGDAYHWTAVPVKEYKPDGSHFQDITRQVLFDESDGLSTQVRYFELAPGGYSTLERHEHVHAVLILRGCGHVLVGEHVHEVGPYDLVHVPPNTWHQFQADLDEHLGFLCLVPCYRDRPVRPEEDDIDALRSLPGVDTFVRT